MHNIFEFRDQKGSLCLNDTMVLHYIELTKFCPNKPRHRRTPFEKWLQVLKFSEKYITMNELPDYLSEEEGVAMAVSRLKEINADREMRQLLEAREKEAHYVATLKKIARDEGHEAGLTEGRAEGLKKGLLKAKEETAIKMYKRGIDIDLISEVTGLGKDDIENLIRQQPPNS